MLSRLRNQRGTMAEIPVLFMVVAVFAIAMAAGHGSFLTRLLVAAKTLALLITVLAVLGSLVYCVEAVEDRRFMRVLLWLALLFVLTLIGWAAATLGSGLFFEAPKARLACGYAGGVLGGLVAAVLYWKKRPPL